MNIKNYKSFGELIRKLLIINKKKKICLIRHAESEGNIKNVLHGSTDYPLTDKGIKDTKNLRLKLNGCYDLIDNIYSSNYLRSFETANVLMNYKQRKNQKIIVKNEFRDLDLGELEGMEFLNSNDEEKNFFVNEMILGGKLIGKNLEPIDKFKNRIIKGISGCEVGINFVFTHFAVIYQLVKELNKNFNHKEFEIDNLSFYCLAFDNDFNNVEQIGFYNFSDDNKKIIK